MSLLAIIECRKRKHRQDVRWIEEIATKKDDVGASHAVAVSWRPFSSGAVNMAARLGIELRTFEEIDEAIALDWVSSLFRGMQDFFLEWDDIKVDVRTPNDMSGNAATPLRQEGVRLDVPFFRLSDGTSRSLDEVFFSEAVTFLVSNFPTGQAEWNTTFVLDFSESDIRYTMDIGGRIWEVVRLSAELRVRMSEQDIDIQGPYQYNGRNGQLSRSAQASATYHGLKVSYTFHDDGARRALVISPDDGRDDRMFRFVIRPPRTPTSSVADQD